MKTLLASLLLFTTILNCRAQSTPSNQPLDILLIGASHNYGKTPVEHFAYPLDKAVAFRPDAVFSEDLSPEDYDALTDYWNKATVEKRLAYIKGHPFADPKHPDRFIQQTYELLRKWPNMHQDRMKLARALFLKHDFGNARYQLYRLDKAKSAFGPEEQQAYRIILGEPDSLYRTQSSEYHNIFFPLLDQLNQDRVLPMDCQQYDLKWQAAWGRADSLFHQWEAGLEADTNSVAARQYDALMKRMNELTKGEKQAAKAGSETQFLNGPEGDDYLYIANFYGGERLFGAANFPKEALTEMLRYWRLRNEGMCRNLVSRARQAGAKRVVVGVGANHRRIMADILRTMPGVTVYTLNEYVPE